MLGGTKRRYHSLMKKYQTEKHLEVFWPLGSLVRPSAYSTSSRKMVIRKITDEENCAATLSREI